VSALGDGILAAQVALVLGGFGYAAFEDVRTREVTDRLWQLLGIAGVLLGAVLVGPSGVVPLGAWLLVGALVLEHMFPWDTRPGSVVERYGDAFELGAYGVVAAVVALLAVRVGVGAGGVPPAAIEVLVMVVFARVLFELGVLYGAADAKAVMIAAVVLPFFATPLLPLSSSLLLALRFLPFAFDLLLNAAVASLAVPIALAIRNVRRGEFRFPRGFTGYSLRVAELPERFVWVRDPNVPPSEGPEPETSAEDRAERAARARALADRGIDRVWVSPQLPFVVLLAVGAVLALLAGNLLLDLVALL
jgi:archaeal preflagellin peptidase FlaK